jgi:hypothetical protein
MDSRSWPLGRGSRGLSHRSGGRAWGRPVNGTESPYLLTGLAQCGTCGGGLFVQSRSHRHQRAYVYACSSFHHRGQKVCGNNQALPMERIDREVLTAFRQDLLNPVAIERALRKLQGRLQDQPQVTADRAAALGAEAERLRLELSRLSAALADGAALSSVLQAIRDREARIATIGAELATLQQDDRQALAAFADVLPEVRQRLTDWRAILSEETGQARQMLRTLLEGRLVFTPRPEAVEVAGQGNYGRLFAGLIPSQALASPTGVARDVFGSRFRWPRSWNSIEHEIVFGECRQTGLQ